MINSRWSLWRLLLHGAATAALVAAGVAVAAPPATAATPAVWVGSPLAARWPTNSDSLPANHHLPYGGDWSVDLQGVGAGAGVYVYAAPQTGGLSITARVEIVRAACASGNIADGGYRVTVGFYNGSTKIGTATYAHINPSVSQGATIGRWGTLLGTVGSYNWSSCWQGVHVHYEMYSQVNYACYNRGWTPGMTLNPTNFLGFIGGSYATGKRQPCP